MQGGFVSGMLDTSMAQHIIFLTKGEMTGLTLDIDVKFYKPCASGPVEAIKNYSIWKKHSFYGLNYFKTAN